MPNPCEPMGQVRPIIQCVEYQVPYGKATELTGRRGKSEEKRIDLPTK